MLRSNYLLSIVVPVFNESSSLEDFHTSLMGVLATITDCQFEIIYCDDGSTDQTNDIIKKMKSDNANIKLLRLSRNFGKELATTAGLHAARGDAIITIDADGQHPVELIPQFLNRWQAGAKVVVGIRSTNQKEGVVKRLGSKVFYQLFNRFAGVKLLPGSTDYRLIDRVVQQDFIRMTERNRITRGLIDWLGYTQEYITFKAKPRMHGKATYSTKKLIKLALDSVISLSISPLYFTAYIGAFILPVSVLLGLFMLVNAMLGDPTNLHATGGAYLEVLLLFLISITLVSQGIIGLYLSHIHAETQNRPLYVVDHGASIGIDEK